MKKLGVLVYPECSIQEVANVMYLFRWHYDAKSVMISSSLNPVTSEEGIIIQPEITVDDFNKEDYYALVLPGISDFTEAVKDEKIIGFLKSFKNDQEFTIGAICAGPILLSMAGLLDDKHFTNSLYVEMNEKFTFIKEKNILYKPLVVDGNIVTAVGHATRLFAIAIARNAGLECKGDVLREATLDDINEDDYKHHLTKEGLAYLHNNFKHFM